LANVFTRSVSAWPLATGSVANQVATATVP
jgi:hypothetical protein